METCTFLIKFAKPIEPHTIQPHSSQVHLSMLLYLTSAIIFSSNPGTHPKHISNRIGYLKVVNPKDTSGRVT